MAAKLRKSGLDSVALMRSAVGYSAGLKWLLMVSLLSLLMLLLLLLSLLLSLLSLLSLLLMLLLFQVGLSTQPPLFL